MRFLSRLVSLIVVAVAAMLLTIPSAQAESSCKGDSCVGVNPANTSCANDAKTIAAMDVASNGMLEMRWSRSCDAGWAKFTTYRRAEIFGTFTGSAISHVSALAWTDKGGQGNAGAIMRSLNGYTVWTKMVDFGRPKVCIGVELFSNADLMPGPDLGGAEAQSLGWTDGPCFV